MHITGATQIAHVQIQSYYIYVHAPFSTERPHTTTKPESLCTNATPPPFIIASSLKVYNMSVTPWSRT